MQKSNIHYKVAFNREFKTVPEANEFIKSLPNGVHMVITYHIPQPQYKTWVPKWLIRFITKK